LEREFRGFDRIFKAGFDYGRNAKASATAALDEPLHSGTYKNIGSNVTLVAGERGFEPKLTIWHLK
jgi:hypothetical protein